MNAAKQDDHTKVALFEQSLTHISDLLFDIREESRVMRRDLKTFEDKMNALHIRSEDKTNGALVRIDAKIDKNFHWALGGFVSVLTIFSAGFISILTMIARINHWI